MTPNGLKRLEGLRGLSDDEYTAWRNDMIQSGKITNRTSFKQADRLYRNQQFVDQFGIDEFNKHSAEQRDEMFRNQIIGQTLQEQYGDDPIYDWASQLLPENQLDFLQSGYIKNEFLDSFVTPGEAMDRMANQSFQQMNEKDAKINQALWTGLSGFAQSLPFSPLNTGKNTKEAMETHNKDLIDRLGAKDDEDRIALAKPISNQIRQNFRQQLADGQITNADIEQMWSDIVDRHDIQFQSGDGSIVNDTWQGSSIWNTYKDRKELADFRKEDITNKLNFLADYYAVMQTSDAYHALSALETQLQNYASDKQSNWDRFGWAMKGIATKASSSIMQDITGIEALGRMTKSAFGDELATQQYDLFLQGKGIDYDENGNPIYNEDGTLSTHDLWKWHNMQYWADVDNFNAFSEERLNQIRENGGRTPYKYLTRAGEEYSTTGAAISEAVSMSGYALGEMAEQFLFRGAGKGVSKITKVGKGLTNTARVINVAGTGISEATMMGKAAYDETYMNAIEGGQQYIDNIVNTQVQRDMQTNEFAQNVENQLNRLKSQYKEAHGGTLYGFDEDAARQQAQQLETEYLKQYYRQNPTEEMLNVRNDVEDEARRASRSAYGINFALYEVRSSAENFAFKDYLFDKGTRMMFGRGTSGVVEEGGRLTANYNKAFRKATAVGKTVAGGFVSEYSDGLCDAFAEGFSLQMFNNHIQKKYDVNAYNEAMQGTSEFLSQFQKGMGDVSDKMSDPENLYEAMIGGLSPFMTYMPRVGQGGRAKLNQMRVEALLAQQNGQGNGRVGFFKTLNCYVMNPLIDAYYTETERQNDIDDRIHYVNDLLDKHRDDFDRMAEIVGLINDKQDTEDVLGAKDNQLLEAFEVIKRLKEVAADEVGQESSTIMDAMREIDRLAKGKLDRPSMDEMVNNFLNDPRNLSLKENPNAYRLAQERLQHNAQKLLDMYKKYEKVQDQLDELGLGWSNNETIYRDQLAKELIMDEDWKKRMSQMEQEISGRSGVSSVHSTTASYGSQQDWQNQLNTSRNTSTHIREQISKTREAIQEYKRRRKELASQKDTQAQVRNLDKLISASELQISSLTQELNEAESRTKQIERDGQLIDWNNVPVLSKDEILALNPEEREKMLTHPEDYSTEQRAAIQEAINELEKQEGNALQKVKDIAELQRRIKINSDSFRKLKTHREDAIDYIDAIRNLRNDYLLEEVYQRQLSSAAEMIRTNFYGDTRQAANTAIEANFGILPMNQLKRMSYQLNWTSSQFIRDLIAQNPDLADILNPILDVKTIGENAAVVINNMDIPNEQKAVFRKNIQTALEGSLTTQEAMDALEEMIDVLENEEHKQIAERIVDEIASQGYSRNQQKIDERQKRKEQKEKEEQALRDAERAKDGSNFGFDGFKAGDTVYNERGEKGIVTRFKVNKKGNNIMLVRFGDNKSETAFTDTSKLSKTAPQKEEVKTEEKPFELKPEETPEETVTPEPTPAQTFEQVEGFTQEGQAIQKSQEEVIEHEIAETPEAQSGNSVQPQNDVTDEGNELPAQDNPAPQMLGNTINLFDHEALRNPIRREQVLRQGQQGDLYDQFNRFLNDRKIRLWDIIDNEVNRIFTKKPDTKIHFLFTKPLGFSQDGTEDRMHGVIFQVVEYTSDVQRIHNDDNGGVITSNGKQWLIIGTLGYQSKNQQQYNTLFGRGGIAAQMRENRDSYFARNTEEQYFVDDTWYTYYKDAVAGRITKKLLGDTEYKFRTLGELMQDAARNPNNVDYSTLTFAIQKNDGNFTVLGAIRDGQVFPIVDKSNVGSVYLMIKAANGNYIPAQVIAANISELVEGSELANNIDALLRRCTSNNLEIRKQAIKELVPLLRFDDNNNILIGNVKHNNITVKSNGQVVFTATLDEAFNYEEFKKAVIEAQFTINLTPKVLTDPSVIELYDKAGVFKMDIAKLGTSDMWYTVYTPVREGQAIQRVEPKPQPKTSTNTEYQRKQSHSVFIGNVAYREDGGKFYTQGTNQVVEEGTPLWISCKYNQLIAQGQLKPNQSIKGKSGKMLDVYVISSDATSPLVIYMDSEHNVTEIKGERAQQVLRGLEQFEKAQQAMQALEDGSNVVYDTTQVVEGNLDQAEILSSADVADFDDEDQQILVESLGGQKPTVEQKAEPVKQEQQKKKEAEAETPMADINNPTSISLNQLQSTENMTTFAAVIHSTEHEDRFYELTEKWGITDESTDEEIEKILKEHEVSTIGITDPNKWLDNIEECKQ